MKKYFITLFCICLSLSLPLFAQKERRIMFESRYNVVTSHDTERVRLTVALPQDRENRQTIEDISFSTEPQQIFEKNGKRYAEFIFTKHPLNYKFVIYTTMKIYKCDWKSLSKKEDGIIPDELLSEYLKSELYIEKDDEMIQEKAKKLVGKTPEKTVQNIYKYVTKNIKYSDNSESDGAKKALETGRGDNTEFTDAFVALCRACSIPARHIKGSIVKQNGFVYHSWAEVYIAPKGWIPLDPTPGNNTKLSGLDNKYFYISNIRHRGDSYPSYVYDYVGPRPTIKSSLITRDLKKE